MGESGRMHRKVEEEAQRRYGRRRQTRRGAGRARQTPR